MGIDEKKLITLMTIDPIVIDYRKHTIEEITEITNTLMPGNRVKIISFDGVETEGEFAGIIHDSILLRIKK